MIKGPDLSIFKEKVLKVLNIITLGRFDHLPCHTRRRNCLRCAIHSRISARETPVVDANEKP